VLDRFQGPPLSLADAHHHHPGFRQAPAYDRLYAAFASGAGVVIADFTATRFCDCSALRRLLTVQRRAVAQGGQLRLVIPSGSLVRRVAVLTGLDGQLHIYLSVREAAAWLKRPARSRRAS
jgi:anti-anti-sigma factor